MRSRLRAETPPPHYWRRWAEDAPAIDSTETAAATAMPESSLESALATQANHGVTGAVEAAPFRVLVVEDDRGQALFAQSVLHGAGMLAEVEMQPEGVLQTIERFKPDLVLMDLHMPGQDGMTLTMQIRQRPELLHLPIAVSYTHRDVYKRQDQHTEAGMAAFPPRPGHRARGADSASRRR